METKRFSPEDLAAGIPTPNAPKESTQTVKTVPTPAPAPAKNKTQKQDSNTGKRVAATLGGAVAGGAAVAGGRAVVNGGAAFEDEELENISPEQVSEQETVEAAAEPVTPVEPQSMSIDIDGDGTIDLIAVDKTGDGVGDALFQRVDKPNLDSNVESSTGEAHVSASASATAHDAKPEPAVEHKPESEIEHKPEPEIEHQPESIAEHEPSVEPEPAPEPIVAETDPNSVEEVEYQELDLDEDGVTDAYAVDTNADGYADVVVADIDGDGTLDFAVADTDYDGEADYAEIDEDGDGVADIVWNANEEVSDPLTPDNDLYAENEFDAGSSSFDDFDAGSDGIDDIDLNLDIV